MEVGFQPVIELDDVTVVLDGDVILKNINLKIKRHDIAIFVGMSGSGKSVLLRTMVGLIQPKAGRVFVLGRAWEEMNAKDRKKIARKVGMQFQKSALFDDLNAAQNIEFVLKEQSDLGYKARHLKALECLRAVDLEKYAAMMPFEMSGGMRQRVGIARALALDPEVLIVDDPTAGLDPVNADSLVKMILNLHRNLGSTLIVVTHDIRRAYQFGGTLYLVANQSVVEVGTAEAAEQSRDPRVHQFITGSVHGPLTDATRASSSS